MNDEADRLFQTARALDAAGRDPEAQRAYLAVLDADAQHFGALTNLAAMLERRGHPGAALQGYREAAQWHPQNVAGHLNLGAALLDAGDVNGARAAFEKALQLQRDCAEAHQGLAAVFARLGNDDAARRHRTIGFRKHSVVHVPHRGTAASPRVLLLLSTMGGNVDLRQFLDDRRYDVWKVFVDALEHDLTLPPHDLVVNAIGDADRCAGALRRAIALLKRTQAPVLNAPRALLATGRIENARRLSTVPGVRAPHVRRIPRSAVEQLTAQGFSFPLLLRAPGHHTGEHFVRVDDATQLAAAASGLPAREILAIEYIDVRGSDGLFRKYRAMAIAGRLFPLHLAASSNWMVHYFSAATLEDERLRAEEQGFLEDMAASLGAGALHTLEDVVETLQLDYAGIDFALDRDGNVVIFEANATMTIPHLAEAPNDYRRPALARVCAAVDRMLRRQSEPKKA